MPTAKKEASSAHKHDDLLKEIATLKKELQSVKSESASLKRQCHSCCGDVANLKKELGELKSAPVSSKDARIDLLVALLNKTGSLELRKLLRAQKEALK